MKRMWEVAVVAIAMNLAIDIDQAIDQSNTCSDEADCSNEGRNEANIWEDDSSDKTGIDIGQSIQQSNECDGEVAVVTRAVMKPMYWGILQF